MVYTLALTQNDMPLQVNCTSVFLDPMSNNIHCCCFFSIFFILSIGKFSTRPYDVRFFLPEIVEHIPDPVPCMTMLFVHAETASELPAHLVTSVVNLTCTSIETSLIATNTDVDDFTDAPMMDIPLDLDIEVGIVDKCSVALIYCFLIFLPIITEGGFCQLLLFQSS